MLVAWRPEHGDEPMPTSPSPLPLRLISSGSMGGNRCPGSLTAPALAPVAAIERIPAPRRPVVAESRPTAATSA